MPPLPDSFARFTVLASGSSANVSFLQTTSGGILIDCGLGPRELGQRLAVIGANWSNVDAIVLTHTHGDHIKSTSLAQILRLKVPFYVHRQHAEHLAENSSDYEELRASGTIRIFEEGVPIPLGEDVVCLPFRVPHDSDPTFGFRFDGCESTTGKWWSLGYASDLGHAPKYLNEIFAEVDVLALEYNHDVQMEQSCGRPKPLIERVLGSHGHLSNVQAAAFTSEILQSRRYPLQALIPLHLSRQCNTPQLAAAAARAVLHPATKLLVASQMSPTNTLRIVPTKPAQPTLSLPDSYGRTTRQLRIPGMDE